MRYTERGEDLYRESEVKIKQRNCLLLGVMIGSASTALQVWLISAIF